MPRPGGEADKFGNRYEGAWTVRHLLQVLTGAGDSITIEDVSELALGSEFTYRRAGAIEVHQLKRQNKLINNWSVRSLASLDIWKSARHHVDAGRQFHFVSEVPARAISELADNARRSGSLDVFVEDWLPNQPMRDIFTDLSSPQLLGSTEAAWKVLRGMWIRWPDEREIIEGNAALAGLLLKGADGRLAAAGLGDLAIHSLGVELTAAVIRERLETYGLQLTATSRSSEVVEQVRAITAAWSASARTEHLEPEIPRTEAVKLKEFVLGDNQTLGFVVGAAGGGKTGVLYQALHQLKAADLPILAFRIDRLENFASTVELGDRLGLSTSPVGALAAVAGDRPSLMVIDQLDAVSLASGRMPGQFDVISSLVREATAFPQIRIVMACRKFDVDNDERIREVVTRESSYVLNIDPLSDSQVNDAVNALGLDAGQLSESQRGLLKLPLHVVLLASVRDDPDALTFKTTGHLFDAFWERKRRNVAARRSGARFGRVISTIAEAMSQRQRLSVPIDVLDADDLSNDADILVSEHILVRDGREFAFFHETFFDYAFARHWVNRGESLLRFLAEGEQELFRRAQVRQVMTHLRVSDPDRFLVEFEQVLSSDAVRFHIKDAILAVLGGVSDPTKFEADVVLEIASSSRHIEGRLWGYFRTSPWFSRLDAEGHIADWLAGDDGQQQRAINLMAAVAEHFPDRLAGLLANHQERTSYPTWLRWIAWRAALPKSRPFFDLVLDAIRKGQFDGYEHDLWLLVYDMATDHPDQAIEVLSAYLIERRNALSLNERLEVAALKMRDHGAADLAQKAAVGSPQRFCEVLLPYLLDVVRVTAHGDKGRPISDAHFSHQIPGLLSNTDLDDVLFGSMLGAIRHLVAEDPEKMRDTMRRLAADPHESAQALLYEGLIAGAAAYATWAADLLLEGVHRLQSGNASNGVWRTRLLLQAISPHLGGEQFEKLEVVVRDLRYPWEARRPGWYAFNLLSALEETRLSDVGRRRLGELRRIFHVSQPTAPQGIITGSFKSPIAPTAAKHMNDDDWLRAMAKHSGEKENWASFTGGAGELSSVLRDEVKLNPARYARLALRLTEDINTAYGDAILMGLGDAEPFGGEVEIFNAVRHVASLGHSENDRWLGWALRPYLKTTPIGMVELLRDRLIATSDPGDDGFRVWGNDEDGRRVGDIYGSGINTARGSLAEALADLLIYDGDGTRTAVVVPILPQLARDPSIPVRACVARLIGAAMRHARREASEAFWLLIEADERLLATNAVLRVLILLGNEDPVCARPVITRMLGSSDDSVREIGGELAVLASLEWNRGELLESVLSEPDVAARQGAAAMAARSLPHTSNAGVASGVLRSLAVDEDEGVRGRVAEVAGSLRGYALRPFAEVLAAVIASPAYAASLSQMLITLERAPDRVDDLALLCSQRFIDTVGPESGDIRTRAAGDARGVSELVIRGLAQVRSKAHRAALLDVLDELLLLGAFGVDDIISASER